MDLERGVEGHFLALVGILGPNRIRCSLYYL
jgi:hypothetical protein